MVSSERTKQYTKPPGDYEIRRFQKEDFLTADGTNFFAWKVIQELVLTCNGWLGFVEGTSRRPDVVIYPEEAEYWNQMDCTVKLQLAFNIDFCFLGELLAENKTSQALWKTLNDRFGRKTSHERFIASSRLNAKRLEVGESFKEHIIALRAFRAEYIDRGGSMDESEWRTIIVLSLPSHGYDTIRSGTMNEADTMRTESICVESM